MNILVLNGSPRGENSSTLQLARAFLSGMERQAEILAEIIPVSKRKIEPCRGCFSCWTKTPGICVIRDDMEEILKKYRSADLVLWSFPLYYFGMPSQMKALTDRLLPLNLPEIRPGGAGGNRHPARYDLSGQRHVLISTCGFSSVRQNYEALSKQFDLIFGAGNYESVFCPEGELFRHPELRARTGEYLDLVRRAGMEYARAGRIPGETREELSGLLYPQEIFLQMANASWAVDSPAGGKEKKEGPDQAEAFLRQMCALFHPKAAAGLAAVLEFELTDVQKTFQMTIHGGSCVLTPGSGKPFTTKIITPLSVWMDIAAGRLSGPAALSEGKYRVLGDFSLMLKLDELFGAARGEDASPAKRELKTNMMLFLFPWIALWALLPYSRTAGAAAGILAAAALPALSARYRLTPYERAGCLLVGLLSSGLLIAPVGTAPLLCVSYLCFSSLWLISCVLRIPLSAHYSCRDYGGSRAFQNPLFLRTNRILTALWGVLYLLTAAFSPYAMQRGMAGLLTAATIAAPALLGLFTAWFAKWYPAKVARG
ncbi:NAD(P)H dehydrogenase [Caproiciproducens sp. NJN-50]|uniref:NAD(P)H-dependent oxidoreductase n=1 Tax=Acutalibacteraceae TaxID=3082771 RepID=UPI000FFE0CC6|nr:MULTISPECIES: NAD(P)H-dependent oxidoreductase [Acutalibacteraceae]QAT50886.1 NAD(P)H dehydrogenase [Caproiciproducens sp. NJN-50]